MNASGERTASRAATGERARKKRYTERNAYRMARKGKLVSSLRTKPIVTQATIQAVIRIGLVAFAGSVISYYSNYTNLEAGVRDQLRISLEGMLRRDSIVFEQTRNIHGNFLAEFGRLYADGTKRDALVSDFDLFFERRADGSYAQRPGVFEGKPLRDGRSFPGMSATYAPDVPPNDDTKARFALSFLLCAKYGSATKNQLFNMYGVVPEKGFPNYQDSDVSSGFSYTGPDPLDLDDYEFFTRGFDPRQKDSFLTSVYYDASNSAWMTTYATPGPIDASGTRKILACSDIVLDDLINSTARAPIAGTRGLIFVDDGDGTLICDRDLQDEIIASGGMASIRSLNLVDYLPLLSAAGDARDGGIAIVNGRKEILAVGPIPGTGWMLAIVYPRALMMASILENLLIVIALGLCTLLLEIYVIRTVLLNQVSLPLKGLIERMRWMRRQTYNDETAGPDDAENEISAIIGEFEVTVRQIERVHGQLERKVRERTVELNALNEKLSELSLTDQLTGIGNRRRFDVAFDSEWNRMRRSGNGFAVIMGDVDWFKKYNDRYGHQAGDECLKSVAAVLRDSARRGTDVVARYGGEEFVILLAETSGEDATRIAGTIVTRIRDLRIPHERSEFGIVTMSFGVASTEAREYRSKEELVQAADSALYAAKANGRNRCEPSGSAS